MKILITGGAGFVGASIARHFSVRGHAVTVLDNLHRRGSEMNLPGFAASGIAFVHGDVRNPGDLSQLDGNFDLLVEASAEPSVHAGTAGSPRFVLDTNLGGAMNCLEFARERCGVLLFLSSSRVYSIGPLLNLPLAEAGERFVLARDVPGASDRGVTEAFACDSQRSFYGASKLAAELLCQEYAAHTRLRVIIDRCGVIAGPGQFGRTDQGVFTLWVARHHFGRPLKYTGFGGRGLQVRDLLHPADLCELLESQLAQADRLSGEAFNVGGGRDGSVSLLEFTSICREATGRQTAIAAEPSTSAVDIPWYISDHARVSAAVGWQPSRRPATIAEEIAAWVRDNESALSGLIV